MSSLSKAQTADMLQDFIRARCGARRRLTVHILYNVIYNYIIRSIILIRCSRTSSAPGAAGGGGGSPRTYSVHMSYYITWKPCCHSVLESVKLCLFAAPGLDPRPVRRTAAPHRCHSFLESRESKYDSRKLHLFAAPGLDPRPVRRAAAAPATNGRP